MKCLVTGASLSALSLAAAAAVTVQPVAQGAGAKIDYANAKPMALPQAKSAPSGVFGAHALMKDARPVARNPGVVLGKAGSGKLTPVRLAPAGSGRDAAAADQEPEGSGASGHPFSTARANIEGLKRNFGYPYSAVGKLFFNLDGSANWCSGSLIKRGLVVTAAHCVSAFGQNRYYSDWNFVPAYNDGFAPFSEWTAQAVAAPAGYLDGTTPCTAAAPGVVCQDDVAVVILNSKNGRYPGPDTGTLGYAWDQSVFTEDGRAHITQVGYPQSLDKGNLMQRNDSEGYVDPAQVNNVIIGSAMNGGSSGGPWVNNFGIRPGANNTYVKGKYNIVTAVTSWGWTAPRVKEQGASPFLSSNIVPLVEAACAAVPEACAD